MASRELTYRINLGTGDAARQARQIRAVVEKELRLIRGGQIQLPSFAASISDAQRLRVEFENAARAAENIKLPSFSAGANGRNIRGGGNDWLEAILGQVPGGLGTLGGAFAGGFAATAVVGGIREIGESIDELGRRGAIFDQINDVLDDYARNANTTADAIVSAAKKAAQGTISEYELILNANRALQFQVAQTPEQFAKLIELSTALGRAQGISDTQALEYITTGLARESRLILDNLGLIINLEQATSDYAATLGKSASDLTQAERKQALLEEAYRQGAVAIAANREAADSAATQFERLDANVQDLSDTFGRWLASVSADRIGEIADAIALVNEALSGGRQEAPAIERDLQGLIEMRDQLASGETINVMGVATITGEQAGMIDFLNEKIGETTERLTDLQLASGQAYSFQIPNADDIIRDEQLAKEEERLARETDLLKEQQKINDALVERASGAVETIGIESALATLKEQKSLVDAAIVELVDSAITDPDELNIRLAELQDNVLGFFDQLEERAQSVDINFGDLALSSDQFNVDFVDFLPGMDELRDRLIDLQSELAYTGSITAEQASELEFLQAAASAAGGEAVFLSAVTNELGTEFLATNEHAALLVDAMYQAVAAYLNGSITAEQYAGVTAALGGQLLTLASEAGIATGAINELIAAQGGLAGTEGFAAGEIRGNSIAQGIATRQQEAQRRQARIDAERAAREQQRLQEKAAREAQRAFEKAARETEKAFEEAARQLESDLRSVPGLFSPTSVTDQDMQFSEAGIYTDQADEYLRRLRDEVLNGTDWADVSIEDAKQSLRELGINVADDNKIALQQFEQAWTNSALFADAENIAKYINDEAVQAALDLQEKARQGQQNILEHFGVVIDEAVDAVVTGAGGSYDGGSGVATIPVQAELIPANGDFTTMPTLGGVSPVIDVAAIQGQIDALDTTITLTPKVNEGAFATLIAGIKTTPVDIVAELDTTTLTTQLSQVGQQTGTIAIIAELDATTSEQRMAQIEAKQRVVTFDAALNDAALLEQMTKIGQQTGTVAILAELDAAATEQRLTQISATQRKVTFNATLDDTSLLEQMTKIGQQTGTITVAAALDTSTFTQQLTQIAGQRGDFTLDASLNTEKLTTELSQISQQTGTVEIAVVAAGDNPALDFFTALDTQFKQASNFFYLIGQDTATQVRAGVAGGFAIQSPDGKEVDTGLIDYLVQRIGAEAVERQPRFTAAGAGIADFVLEGARNQFSPVAADGSVKSALTTGMLDSMTQGIRANASNFQQRGITVAEYVKAGFLNQFASETFKANIEAAGGLMAGYLKQGILSNLNGLADTIASAVIDDISTSLEAE